MAKVKSARKVKAKTTAKRATSAAKSSPAKSSPAKSNAASKSKALKTRPTGESVAQYLARIPDAERRADCSALVKLMRAATDAPPKLWGHGMVGFGAYAYRYASGHGGEWFLTGFAATNAKLTLYILPGGPRFGELRARLGPHTGGKSCFYVKRLADLDLDVLRDLVADSVAFLRARSASSLHAASGAKSSRA